MTHTPAARMGEDRSLPVCMYCGCLTESHRGRFVVHGNLLACRGSGRPIDEIPPAPANKARSEGEGAQP